MCFKHNKVCLFTNDVETTSLVRNNLHDDVIPLLLNQALPLLLRAFQDMGIRSTFFFTGYIAERCPRLVEMVVDKGHEVACHGYSHQMHEALGVLSLSEQVRHIYKAKNILETITGQPVVSFRAPALRVNSDTAKALQETGFLNDSSVSSQRFDLFLSHGARNKIRWFGSPRRPYFTDKNDLTRRGDSNIFEIPISAFFLPYIGTSLRLMPWPIKVLRHILAIESALTSKPINFLMHPNEFMDEENVPGKVIRRSANFIQYLLADIVRNRLKKRNLGSGAFPMFIHELEFFQRKGFQFMSIGEYRNWYVENEVNAAIKNGKLTIEN
jgi:peptidoglycan-N-acetylglucosamine deacetylase